jgi:TPR repeat protein
MRTKIIPHAPDNGGADGMWQFKVTKTTTLPVKIIRPLDFVVFLLTLASIVYHTQASAEGATPETDIGQLSGPAEQGDSNAQYHLGMEYLKGTHGDADIRQGILWLEAAAQQGHKSAQMELGRIYEFGAGGNIDIAKALYWYRKAAAGKESDASLRVFLLQKQLARTRGERTAQSEEVFQGTTGAAPTEDALTELPPNYAPLERQENAHEEGKPDVLQ